MDNFYSVEEGFERRNVLGKARKCRTGVLREFQTESMEIFLSILFDMSAESGEKWVDNE